jgi:flavin prenyltransferase
MRIVLAITGATGAIYGVKLAEALFRNNVEVHLVVSRWGLETLKIELELEIEFLVPYVYKIYNPNEMTAAIASGSFPIDGMVVAPCSMKTLSAIVHGYSDNLIVRAADVALKERRPLILMTRETPCNTIHLKNMLEASSAGATIFPPMPAFYNHPQSIDDLVNHSVGRILDLLGISNELVRRWGTT